VTDSSAVSVDRDAEQLKALGYVSHFDRTMSKWENFSLGFTYLSPVVGVYTIFASAFIAGGPPMWWTYILVGLGQLMVCLVFGEIVSQFPISGGLYPWARRLVGKRWAWMAGWVYAWALCCTMAGVATGVAPFLAQLFGVDSTPVATTIIALALIAMTTFLNLSGTRLLARVAMFGFICELVGAIVVGGYLLLFARHQPLKVLLDTTLVPTHGSYWPAFLASSLAAMFCYYGFEACGDVAEETPNASRMIRSATGRSFSRSKRIVTSSRFCIEGCGDELIWFFPAINFQTCAGASAFLVPPAFYYHSAFPRAAERELSAAAGSTETLHLNQPLPS